MEVTGGGYPGFKDKHKKYSAKPSLSSASNASTGSTKRLIWQFLKAIDLCQGKFRYEVEIEKTMKMPDVWWQEELGQGAGRLFLACQRSSEGRWKNLQGKGGRQYGTQGYFLDFALDKCIYKLLSNHGEKGIEFYQVVCLGHQLDNSVFV